MGLHFLPLSVEGAIRLLDAMVDNQVVNGKAVGIEVLDDTFRLLDSQRFGDGDHDVFREALISDKGGNVIGERLPSCDDLQERSLAFLQLHRFLCPFKITIQVEVEFRRALQVS